MNHHIPSHTIKMRATVWTPQSIAFSQLHSLSLIPSITHTAAQTVSHSLFLSHSLSLSSSLILYSPSSHFIILVSKFTHLLFLSYSWVDRGREWWSGGGRSGGNYCVLCVVCAQCSCADVFLLIYLIKTYIGLTHFFILILIYTPVTHTHTHTHFIGNQRYKTHWHCPGLVQDRLREPRVHLGVWPKAVRPPQALHHKQHTLILILSPVSIPVLVHHVTWLGCPLLD